MLKVVRLSFQNATQGVLYSHNTTLYMICVLKMITSGSLISVRFRIVQLYGSEFYLLLGCIGGWAAPQNREAIFGDVIAVPSFALLWSRDLPSAPT